MKRGVLSIFILLGIIIFVDLIFLFGVKIPINSGFLNGLSSLNLFGEENQNNYEEKIVTKIIDGDTIIVEGGEHVRLLGIDCDEKGKKCYKTANMRIEELILGKRVKLEKEREDKDQYGRSLRYVFLDEKNINLEMVKEGICVARFDGGYSKYQKIIQNAEKESILNKTGCKWK